MTVHFSERCGRRLPGMSHLQAERPQTIFIMTGRSVPSAGRMEAIETKICRTLGLPCRGAADMRDTEVTEINGADASGEGIACVVKTAEDISARLILPEGNIRKMLMSLSWCDASGAPLNRSGDYFRTENRDISTVYVFLCGEKTMRRSRTELSGCGQEERLVCRSRIQSLREYALYSEKVHFESEYLSVVQAAWGGR